MATAAPMARNLAIPTGPAHPRPARRLPIRVSPIPVPHPPVFQSVTLTQGTLDLTWSTEAGASCQLQYISDLNSTNWTNLGGPQTATGPTLNATDYTTNELLATESNPTWELLVVISANAVQAAPAGLAVTVSTAAALGGTAIAGTAAATATKTTALTTIQKAIAGVALAAAVGTGIYQAHEALSPRSRLPTLRSQPTILARDDGQAAGKWSFGDSGHVVRFEAPGPNSFLTAVQIHGSRYGTPSPPRCRPDS